MKQSSGITELQPVGVPEISHLQVIKTFIGFLFYAWNGTSIFTDHPHVHRNAQLEEVTDHIH